MFPSTFGGPGGTRPASGRAAPSLGRRSCTFPGTFLVLLLIAIALPLPAAEVANEPALPPPTNTTPATPSAPVIPIERPARTNTVDFHREILPVLQANCLPCHNQTTPKGELVLESPGTMLKGGESGPALIAGKASDSLLLKVSTHEAKPRMPPRENKANAVALTPAQLGLIALWIDQGAPAGQGVEPPIAWQSVPSLFAPIYAVALSPDGRFAASGRANQIHVYRPAAIRLVQRLEDPALPDGAAQRDIVHALAFSPDGRWLAAGGFRETRLWRYTDPVATPLPGPTHSNSHSNSYSIASFDLTPDRATLALVRTSGAIDLIRLPDGTLLRTLSPPGPAASLIRFSPEGRRLASANGLGQLHVWDLSDATNVPAPITLTNAPANANPATTTTSGLGAPITGLAWFDAGRQLAVAIESAPVIRTFQFSGGPPGILTEGRTLSAHTARPTALADAAALGSGLLLATGADDGTVRLWTADPAREPAVLTIGSPVTALIPIPGSHRIAVATRTGGTRVWSTDGTPKSVATLAGDTRLALRAGTAELRLASARNEVAFHKGALQRQEEDVKKRTDESAKAAEKHQANEKALAGKQQELAQEEAKKAPAEKEKSELTVRLQQARDAHAAAQKAAEAARLAARESGEKNAETRLAAEQAGRTRAELDRLLTDLAGTADETTLARTREAAAHATRTAEARIQAAQAARQAAEKAIDTLAIAATAAGETKATEARAAAELPPRIQQAAERLAAAFKAVDALKPQVERARIQRDTSDADVQLARRNLDAANLALAGTRLALAAAEPVVTEVEAGSRQATASRDAAAGRGHVWIGITPDGRTLATLDDEGCLASWSADSLEPLDTHPLPAGAARPIALTADGAILLATESTVTRLPLEGRWHLARTFGGSLPDGRPAFVDRVNALGFSPDGRFLATGGGEPSRSGELRIWSVPDGSLVRDLGALHSDCVLSVAFSPAGDLLASGGADRFLRLSDPATGKLIRNFEGHSHHVLGVGWKSDGRVLASGGGEGVVKLWNRLTGERLRNVDGFGKEVTGIQALGIAAEFLAVSGAGQARIFKEDGTQVRVLPAGNAFLTALAVTPDGRLAASGGDDGVLHVWKTADGKVLAAFPPDTTTTTDTGPGLTHR